MRGDWVKQKIKDYYKKRREIILYALFGVLTTLANLFAFLLTTKLFGEELVLINNAIAWIAGVVTAFVTNKLYVFNSKSWKPKIAIKEFAEFTGARPFSFVFEEVGMWVFVTVLHFSDKSLSVLAFDISGQLIAKILLSIVVVAMNYFFSKFIIFKKKK